MRSTPRGNLPLHASWIGWLRRAMRAGHLRYIGCPAFPLSHSTHRIWSPVTDSTGPRLGVREGRKPLARGRSPQLDTARAVRREAPAQARTTPWGEALNQTQPEPVARSAG